MSKDINSKSYWDNRFLQDWDLNSGREQTLYFCNLTLNLLPDWMINSLDNGLTFADIGCAEGDCTNFLAQKFPSSKFTGIDFSSEAIAKASSTFPNEEFIASDIKEINRTFDVVFSSNTLEHFHRPFEILDYLFNCSNQYVIILLPFQERERFREHFYTFEYKDFKLQNGDFTLVYSREYDCSKVDNIFWAGKQILLIYERKGSFLNEVTLDSFVGELSEDYNHLKYALKGSNEELERSKTLLAEKEGVLKSLVETNNKHVNEYYDLNTAYIRIREKLATLERESSNQKTEVVELIQKLDYLTLQEQWLKNENYKLTIESNQIKNSDFWKLALKYYYIRDRTPLKFIYKSIKVVKNHGWKTFFSLVKNKLKRIRTLDPSNEIDRIVKLYNHVTELNNINQIEGVAIVPAAFPFDELYNQRTINLAKYLSTKKIVTLFVIWQWEGKDLVDKAFEEVYPLVYSVPLYSFLDSVAHIGKLSSIPIKTAFLNIPSESYMKIIPDLRKHGFSIIYDIMDEWEEFNKVDQAPWYDKHAEESIVLQADKVVAVSQSLIDKFSFLRNDIELIGNGYYSSLLKTPNISLKTMSSNNMIHVGYFGHLTDSWFDWDLIFKVANSGNVTIHVIGYGAADELISKIKKQRNIIFYGKVAPNDLASYVKKWHVGIIPFKRSKLSEAVDPIKIYEYLYFGLPVVVTGIEHLSEYPWVYVSESNNEYEFVKGIELQYHKVVGGEYKYSDLSTFLIKTQWESRFDQLMHLSTNTGFARLYANAKD